MLQKQTEGNSCCAAAIALGIPQRESQRKVENFACQDKRHWGESLGKQGRRRVPGRVLWSQLYTHLSQTKVQDHPLNGTRT